MVTKSKWRNKIEGLYENRRKSQESITQDIESKKNWALGLVIEKGLCYTIVFDEARKQSEKKGSSRISTEDSRK